MAVSFPSSSRTRKLQNITYIEEEEEDDGSDMEGGIAGDDGMLEKRGTWKPEEDEIVLEHVRKHGPHNWSLIPSSGLLARPGKSCRTRWTNKLDPNLKKEPLSDDEKRTILQMQSEIGNKWAKIAGSLPGRTDNDVKNFWMGCQKRLARITNPQRVPSQQQLERCPKRLARITNPQRVPSQQQLERCPKRVARSSKTRSQQKLSPPKRQKLSRKEEHNGASNGQLPGFGHIKPPGVSVDTKPYKERKSNLKSEKISIGDPHYFIHLSGQQINHSLLEPVRSQSKQLLKSTPQCREDSSIESYYNSQQGRTHPSLQGSNQRKQLPSSPQYTQDSFTRNSSNMGHNPQRSYFTLEPNCNLRRQNLRSNVFCCDTGSEGFGEQPPEQFPGNGQQPENSTGKQPLISNTPLLEPPFFDFPSLPSAAMLEDIWSQNFRHHPPEKLSSYRTNVDPQESMSMSDVISDNMDGFMNNVIDIVSDEHDVQPPVKLLSYGTNVYMQERMSIDDVISNNMDGFLDNVIDKVSDEHDVQPPVNLLSYTPSDNVQKWPEQSDLISDDFFDELPDIIDLSDWDCSI